MHGAGVVAAAVLGYLLGSFPSADLASHIATRGDIDLRATGSGNPGATNAAQVLVSDIAKGVAAGFAGRALGGDAGAYLAATAVIAGHIAPVWSGFRGGKGVATSAGACLAVFPAYFPIYIALAAVVAIVSHSSERAAQVSGAAWIAAAIVWWARSLPNAWGPRPGAGIVAFVVASTVMILAKFALGPSVAEPA